MSWRRARPAKSERLELDAEGELALAGGVLLAGDAAELGVGDVGLGGGEDGAIEGVEEFGAELDENTVHEAESLDEAEVLVEEVGIA